MLTSRQMLQKRLFDLILSTLLLIIFFPLMFFFVILASIATLSIGVYHQKRIGRDGKSFNIYKIKTMIDASNSSSVTISSDPRITLLGAFMRKFKVDELPQLWNIMVGDMSFVGPRPDVSGFADKLIGNDRKILLIRPGVTGPASIKYRNEGHILAKQDFPEEYNRDVIWPDKVRINLEYIENWKFSNDIFYIFKSLY